MRKSLICFYDMAVSPCSYDFFTFLISAELCRVRRRFDQIKIVFVQGPKNKFREDNLRSISQNKIFSRNFDSQVLIPTTTITNDIYLNKPKLFGGVSIGGNSKQINFLSGDLLYKSKRDNVYGVGLGVNESFQPIVIGRVYWKISFKGKK